MTRTVAPHPGVLVVANLQGGPDRGYSKRRGSAAAVPAPGDAGYVAWEPDVRRMRDHRTEFPEREAAKAIGEALKGRGDHGHGWTFLFGGAIIPRGGRGAREGLLFLLPIPTTLPRLGERLYHRNIGKGLRGLVLPRLGSGIVLAESRGIG